MEKILFETKTIHGNVKITLERIEGSYRIFGFGEKKEFSVNVRDIQSITVFVFSPEIYYNKVIVYDKSFNKYQFCYRRKYIKEYETVKKILDKKICDLLVENKKQEQKNKKLFLIERENFGIPQDIKDFVILCKGDSFNRQREEYALYNNGTKLLFFSTDDYIENKLLNKFELNLSDIIYFKKEGNRNITTEISGGGTITRNKGIIDSEEIYYLNKASGGKKDNELIAAMLANKVEKEIEPIKTTRTVDDDRRVVLKLENSEIYFSFDSYNVFLKVIPKKDYERLLLNSNNFGEDYEKTLKDLKKLLDVGLIDKDDYNKKKAEILFGQKE